MNDDLSAQCGFGDLGSRPLSRIEYEQRGRICELEAEVVRLRDKCRKAEASLAQIVNDDSTDRFVYGRINEAFAAVREEQKEDPCSILAEHDDNDF